MPSIGQRGQLTIVLLLSLIITCVVCYFWLYIYVYVWWGRVRYDWGYPQDNNIEATELLSALYNTWLFFFISMGLQVLANIIGASKDDLNDPGAGGIRFFGMIFGLIAFIFTIKLLKRSTKVKCSILNAKGTPIGRNSSEFMLWYREYEAMNSTDFDRYRCEDPGSMVLTLFLGYIISMIIVVIIILVLVADEKVY